jgi:hypothetical protein
MPQLEVEDRLVGCDVRREVKETHSRIVRQCRHDLGEVRGHEDEGSGV